MYDAMLSETIRFPGHQGEEIVGYLGRPLAPGPAGGVVVLHHMPGYDRESKEVVRTFAAQGYNALCPNLHHRALPGGGDPREASRLTREAGGVPDEQCVGDVAGAMAVLKSLTSSNGKVGVIGYCSGGRQAYLVACTLRFDAAVDCYGGRVAPAPDEIDPAVTPPVALTAHLSCPLLGLFGARDNTPSPAETARIEVALQEHGKEYVFHTYDDAGHAFFSVDRPNYAVEAALDGWARVWEFLGRHLTP